MAPWLEASPLLLLAEFLGLAELDLALFARGLDLALVLFIDPIGDGGARNCPAAARQRGHLKRVFVVGLRHFLGLFLVVVGDFRLLGQLASLVRLLFLSTHGLRLPDRPDCETQRS